MEMLSCWRYELFLITFWFYMLTSLCRIHPAPGRKFSSFDFSYQKPSNNSIVINWVLVCTRHVSEHWGQKAGTDSFWHSFAHSFMEAITRMTRERGKNFVRGGSSFHGKFLQAGGRLPRAAWHTLRKTRIYQSGPVIHKRQKLEVWGNEWAFCVPLTLVSDSTRKCNRGSGCEGRKTRLDFEGLCHMWALELVLHWISGKI